MTATLVAIGVFCAMAGMTVGVVIGGLLGATRQCAGCNEPDVPYTVNPGGIVAPPKPCERMPGERVAPLTDVNREALGQ